MKKRLFFLILIPTFFIIQACDNSMNSEINEMQKEKVPITVNNIGEIHNYLLEEYSKKKSSNFIKTTSEVVTFGDVYQDLKKILSESDEYSMTSTIQANLSKSGKVDLLDNLKDLKLDENFITEIKKKFTSHVKSLKNADSDVIASLLKTLDDYNSPITNTLENKEGSELLAIYNNVYKSSTEYWNINTFETKTSTKSASNREIIWADAAGAVLGAGCGGVMSILMAAAFSDSYDRCAAMNEELDEEVIDIGEKIIEEPLN